MFDTINKTLGFQLAAASVAGRDHLAIGRNNQDAFALRETAGALCVAVADGCGSAPFSEVGARVGSRLCVNLLAKKLEAGAGALLAAGRFDQAAAERFLEELRHALLNHLRPLALALAGTDDPRALAGAVRDHLLFTLLGAVATPEETLVFALGDGAAAVDGVLAQLGPFAGNEPPYLAYALLPESAHGFADSSLRFQLLSLAKTRALALGTDGALELFAQTTPASLSQEELLFKNPDALRRKLSLLAKPGGASGRAVLHDDTTLVLLRARREEREA